MIQVLGRLERRKWNDHDRRQICWTFPGSSTRHAARRGTFTPSHRWQRNRHVCVRAPAQQCSQQRCCDREEKQKPREQGEKGEGGVRSHNAVSHSRDTEASLPKPLRCPPETMLSSGKNQRTSYKVPFSERPETSQLDNIVQAYLCM